MLNRLPLSQLSILFIHVKFHIFDKIKLKKEFYSIIDIVICGGTDKSIEVFDMNEAKSCLTIHEAHSRPFHQILQNPSEHNRLSYDLFLSNAVNDGIKLWDLRSAKYDSFNKLPN